MGGKYYFGKPDARYADPPAPKRAVVPMRDVAIYGELMTDVERINRGFNHELVSAQLKWEITARSNEGQVPGFAADVYRILDKYAQKKTNLAATGVDVSAIDLSKAQAVIDAAVAAGEVVAPPATATAS
ncbi:hypothetical protein [Bradyrhizobium sp. USDA 10063]